MAVTRQDYTQAGSTITYVVPFEVIEATDIDVYVNNVLQLQQNTTSTADATHPQVISGEITQGTALTNYTVASNNGTITFNAVLTAGDYIVVERTTDDAAAVTFVSGSTIRAKDLNDSFDQIRFLAQEAVFTARQNVIESRERDNSYTAQGYKIENLGDADSDDDAVNRGQLGKVITDDLLEGDAINLTDATGGTNSNKQVTISVEKSTASQQGVVKITTPSVTNGNPITINRPADGDVELSIADGSIDFSKIKDVDIITEAEQVAQSPNWEDTYLATAAAISERHDVIVSTVQPTTTQVGKQWLNITPGNQEHKIYDGSGWRTVAVGQPYTPTTATIVRYVDATNGSDAAGVTGFLPQSPLKSIKRAVDLINADSADGSLVVVSPGVYQETLPIQIERENVSIVGTALRSCFVQPTQATETNTMFEVNSGTLLANMTFVGLKASGTVGNNTLDPGATYGLPTNQGWAVAFYNNAIIKKSPYIQNCTNFADSNIDNSIKYDQTNLPGDGLGGDQTSGPTGGGLLIDGSVPSSSSPLRSMVVDSFTQILLNGPGVLCTNNAYSQLVSFFGTFCRYHAKALNGGQLNLSNCTTDFGEYGLIADGKSPTNIFTATANGTTLAGSTTFTISATTPDASWHGDQTNPRPLDNMLVQIGGNANGTGGTIYPILSSAINGAGYDVTISNPDPNDLSFNLGLAADLTNGTTVRFFLRSLISTGGHTFEYVGSGTDYRGLPDYGGVAVDANQVKNLNDGKVWQSSTDQNGLFKVGDTFSVNQKTGVVTIPAAASSGVQKTAATGSAIIPTGSTGQRDVSPAAGYFRFNSTDGSFEGYDGTAWGSVGGATPAGVSGSIQINDGAGNLGAVTDFKWDTANTELDIPGDINLDDGGTYTTTVQSITATADRFISFPDATGVVALVQGINGAVQFNNAGVSGGGNLGYDSTAGTFGYISGSDAETQTTNKSTGVTLNAPCGRITMNGAALSADTTVTFTLTNSSIGANDLLVLNHVSGGTAGSYLLNAQAAAGSASINVRNITAGSLSEAIVIGFAIIKS